MGNHENIYLALVIILSGFAAAALLLWELARSHLRFKAICDNSGNMVIIGRAITDKSKRIVDVEIVGCNEVYARHLDKTVAEVIGLLIVRDFFEGDEPEWFSVIKETITTHESKHLEFEYLPMGTRYSGSVFCLSAIRKRCCFLMDEISQEYNQKRELQKVRQEMDTIFEMSGVEMWQWSLKERTLKVFKSSFPMAEKYDGDVISLKDMLSSIHSDDHSAITQLMKNFSVDDHLVSSVDYRVGDEKGGWHWFQAVVVKTEYDRNGLPEYLFGINLDIDSLKRSQIRVEDISIELEEKQQQLVSSMHQCRTGVCSWDVRSDKVFFSDKFWESIGGISLDLGVPVPDTMEMLQSLTIPDEPNAVANWVKQIREGNKTIDKFDFRCQVAFVPDVWLEIRNSVLERDESGCPLIISAFVIDITKLVKHEQVLLSMMQDADAASKAKSRFLAVMSHEIRTPLNAIIGFSSIIRNSDISSQLQSYSESIKSSGEMLLTLINDLLDLAKIDSNKMNLKLAAVNMHDILFELRGMFALKVKSKGLYLDVNCPDNLPLFNLDSKRITQVFINLIGNAVKFTDTGGITVTLKYEIYETSGFDSVRDKLSKLIIDVKDTGDGIFKKDFDCIFNPFEQASGQNKHYVEGSGLGLSICKNLVGLMGGAITFASEVGVGSDFVVTLDNVKIVQNASDGCELKRYVCASEKPLSSLGISTRIGSQKEVFAAMFDKFGEQFVELERGMHVQFAHSLVEELQHWMVGQEAPQVRVVVNALEQAVKDFNVTEVKRLSKFLIKRGSNNGE